MLHVRISCSRKKRAGQDDRAHFTRCRPLKRDRQSGNDHGHSQTGQAQASSALLFPGSPPFRLPRSPQAQTVVPVVNARGRSRRGGGENGEVESSRPIFRRFSGEMCQNAPTRFRRGLSGPGGAPQPLDITCDAEWRLPSGRGHRSCAISLRAEEDLKIRAVRIIFLRGQSWAKLSA